MVQLIDIIVAVSSVDDAQGNDDVAMMVLMVLVYAVVSTCVLLMVLLGVTSQLNPDPPVLISHVSPSLVMVTIHPLQVVHLCLVIAVLHSGDVLYVMVLYVTSVTNRCYVHQLWQRRFGDECVMIQMQPRLRPRYDAGIGQDGQWLVYADERMRRDQWEHDVVDEMVLLMMMMMMESPCQV